jgi:hypothetical protein
VFWRNVDSMELDKWSQTDLIKPGGFTERAAHRLGYLLGAGIGWLLLAAVVAVPIAWWLAQVLR